MEQHEAREAYEAPDLTEFGTVEEWTHEFIDISGIIG
jgi:hypothetical protein